MTKLLVPRSLGTISPPIQPILPEPHHVLQSKTWSKMPLLYTLLLLCPAITLSAQGGIFYKSNPVPTHYFIAPTGFALKDGDQVFQNNLVAFNHVSMGRRNNKVLGYGFVPSFLVTGKLDYVPIWVSARKSFSLAPGFPRITVGGVGIDLPKAAEGDAFALYASSTFGSKDRNLTAGVLWLQGSAKNTSVSLPWAITLHGMVRAGMHTWLITENYILQTPGQPSYISINGFRMLKGKVAFDAGIAFGGLSLDNRKNSSRRFFALPMVGMKIPFKGKTSKMIDLMQGEQGN